MISHRREVWYRALLWGLLMVAATAGPVLTAAPASAHASVLTSTPADGARLDGSPSALSFDLSEPVSLVEGSAQVIDADGTRYPLTEQRLEAGRQRVVLVPAQSLSDGAYLATARVISADTHVVSLSIRFTVGQAVEPGQWAKTDGEWVIGRSILLPVKIATYLGTVVSAGLLLASRWAWPEAAGSRRFRIVYRSGAALLVIGLMSRFAVLVIEQAGGLSDSSWSTITAVAATPGGAALVAAAVLSTAAFWFPPDRGRGAQLLGFGQAAFAITAITLGGHGGSAELWPLPFLVTFIHVYAVSVWLGGIAIIALVTRGLPELQRWHRVAFGHLGLVVLAGIGLALFQVRPLAALVSTSYGVTLMVKVALVALAVAIGYLVYRRAGESGHRRTALIEAGVALLVIAATANLSALTPAEDSYTTDFVATVDFGGAQVLDVRIDTVRRGSQVVTVEYPATTTGDSAVLGLELSSAQANIARLPVAMTPSPADDGTTRWHSEGLIVPSAGQWKVTLRFDTGGGPKLASFYYTVL